MDDSKYFDRFMRDYLTVKTGQLPNIGQVYESFKKYWITVRDIPVEKLMGDVIQYSKYYANLVFADFEDSDVSKIAKNINTLKVEVVYPFLLEVLEDYKNQTISKSELIEIMKIAESYVFRRAICGVPTNSLNKTFANLTKEIDKEHSNNPVPFLIISNELHGQAGSAGDPPEGDLSLMHPVGVLADVAPTMLKILGIEQPKEMTGRALI